MASWSSFYRMQLHSSGFEVSCLELAELRRLEGSGIPLMEMTTMELAKFLVVIATHVASLRCPSVPLRSKMIKAGPRGERQDRFRDAIRSYNYVDMQKTCTFVDSQMGRLHHRAIPSVLSTCWLSMTTMIRMLLPSLPSYWSKRSLTPPVRGALAVNLGLLPGRRNPSVEEVLGTLR